jgi:hypothetical protein
MTWKIINLNVPFLKVKIFLSLCEIFLAIQISPPHPGTQQGFH